MTPKHDILHVFSSSLAARAVVRAEELTATCHTPSLPAIHLDRADDCKSPAGEPLRVACMLQQMW